MPTATEAPLPEGLVAFVKRDCPTCTLVAPLLAQLEDAGRLAAVYSQDDPSFPDQVTGVEDDTSLERSWRHDIETVPTLIRVEDGAERERIVGWAAEQWRPFTGVDDLGEGLPEHRPGCGSLSVDPDRTAALEAEYGDGLGARRVGLAAKEDEFEALWDRGWTDGYPAVPPTPERVIAMLEGTPRAADEVVAMVPPDLAECTVEKVAINAVMAGCRPEYLPVVLTALEAVCTDEFNMHGVLATTMPVGPIVVVNGPIRDRIGLNSGGNALGNDVRANATIGRALQLVIRNVGGGKPRGVDRANQGHPGKVGFCIAEDEAGSPWEPLSVENGLAPGTDAVTVFTGEGPRTVVDQLSRTPESLSRTFAAALRSTVHHKLVMGFDAMLVVSPEHSARFADAGWTKARLREELDELLLLDSDQLVRGADGITEGLPEAFAGAQLPKFRPGGLLIVHAGGPAGLFSAVIGGWVNGDTGSQWLTKRIGG